MRELAGKACRKRSIGNAVIIGQLAFRHVEGAENDVEDREGCREVLFPTLVGRVVMPAVEYRSGDNVFERPKRPVEIGMHERGMRDGERSEYHEDIGRYAGNQQYDVGKHRA